MPVRPQTTLFMITRKTFTIAGSMHAWFLDAVTDEAAVAKPFIVLSTNTKLKAVVVF